MCLPILIHGDRTGSSADKARHRTTPTGLEAQKGSSQSGQLVTMSKPSPTKIRGLSRSVEAATGGSTYKSGRVRQRIVNQKMSIPRFGFVGRQRVVAQDRQEFRRQAFPFDSAKDGDSQAARPSRLQKRIPNGQACDHAIVGADPGHVRDP